MSENDQHRFSPFFRVRNILLILRWSFGFPLKAKNKAFNEFVFLPCLEYTRYAVYLCCFFLSFFCITYPKMKANNLDNLLEALQENYNRLGFTLLDIFVVIGMPFYNLISSIFYLASFRKEATRISKVCLHLTTLKKELYDLSDKEINKVKQSYSKRSLKLVVFGIFFAGVFWILVVAMFIEIQEGLFNKLLVSNEDRFLYLVGLVIFPGCWIYPSIAISADFIICHLLDEIAETFSKWNSILKVYRDQRQEKQPNCTFMTKKNKNVDWISERNIVTVDLGARVENYSRLRFIDSVEASLSAIETNEGKGEHFNAEKIMSIGTSLVKVTRKTDKSLGGMILNTYTNCLFITTSILYVGSSVFFNKYKGMAVFFISFGCIGMTILSIMRLLYHTNAGQHVSSSMKACAHTLDRIPLKRFNGDKLDTIKLLKKDLKDYGHSPINPFSAFSLSNSTLLGTFATILTYLIVLVQFKAAEDDNQTKLFDEMKDMLRNCIANNGNITEL